MKRLDAGVATVKKKLVRLFAASLGIDSEAGTLVLHIKLLRLQLLCLFHLNFELRLTLVGLTRVNGCIEVLLKLATGPQLALAAVEAERGNACHEIDEIWAAEV